MSEHVDVVPRLRVRRVDAHKGDFGRALLIGGSRGMSGAIALAGMATLRSGAGLVTLALPTVCLETVAGLDSCYMTVPLPCDAEGRLTDEATVPIAEMARRATAGACGPGLGQSEKLDRLIPQLYATLELPLVFDADALNALARTSHAFPAPAGPRVLTPHPGEFDRLAGSGTKPADRTRLAEEMADRLDVIMVLKGHRTLVTDGTRSFHNTTGNPGMATGGSGDVLTGIITALLCQGLSPWDAACLGVHAHGLAGDMAADSCSQVALTATDIIEALCDVWPQVSE